MARRRRGCVDRKSGRGIRWRRGVSNARSDVYCPLPVPDVSYAAIAPEAACTTLLRSLALFSLFLLKPHLRSLITFVPVKESWQIIGAHL
jgi:hypothetical protein